MSGEEVTGAAQARDEAEMMLAWAQHSDVDVGTGQMAMLGIASGEGA